MKLWHSFKKDMTLALRNWYFYMELVMAIIFIAIMLFVVPENFSSNMTYYTYFDLNENMMEMVQGEIEKSPDEFIFLNSREEVINTVEDKHSSVGAVVTLKNNKLEYEIILQGYENEKFRNIIETSILSSYAPKGLDYEEVISVTTLEENSEKLTDRLRMLPVFLTINAGYMGLLIIATYVFMDKQNGTIKALIVTPSKIWHYLLGKVGVLLVAGLSSAIITTIFIAGMKANYFHLIMLVIATNTFGSVIGLFIASFFNSIEKAMGWIYMSIIIIGFAVVSYYMPAFSPIYIKIIPSYPMLFAFREMLLDNPNVGYIYLNVGGFLLASAIVFLITNYRFKKTLTV